MRIRHTLTIVKAGFLLSTITLSSQSLEVSTGLLIVPGESIHNGMNLTVALASKDSSAFLLGAVVSAFYVPAMDIDRFETDAEPEMVMGRREIRYDTTWSTRRGGNRYGVLLGGRGTLALSSRNRSAYPYLCAELTVGYGGYMTQTWIGTTHSSFYRYNYNYNHTDTIVYASTEKLGFLLSAGVGLSIRVNRLLSLLMECKLLHLNWGDATEVFYETVALQVGAQFRL